MALHLPLVSIGVPVYNGALTLDEALTSLRQQTYPHLEIIISDDASSDCSAAICIQHAEQDRRIIYYRQPTNLGAADNFNFVLNRARGTYFFWHAQDDLRADMYTEKCIGQLQANQALIFCHSMYVDFLHTRSEHRNLRSIAHLTSENLTGRFLHAYKSRIGSTAFYGIYNLNRMRKKLRWENYNGSDIAIFQAMLLEGSIAEVSEVLFFYRFKPYVRGKKEHLKFLRRSNSASSLYFPGWILFVNIIKIVIRSNINRSSKCYLVCSLIWWEGITIVVKLLYFLILKASGKHLANLFLRKLKRSDIQPMDIGFRD